MNDKNTMADADRIQEELVAYLDGELDQQTSDEVVRRLGSDPVYQHTLKELQAAWDLLDELPRADAPESFTQTTLEMVRVTMETETFSVAKQAGRRRTWEYLGLGVVVCVAGIATYAVITQQLDKPNQELVRDLPVIENVDSYRVADSVDFLRQLDKENLFIEESADAP